MIYNYFIEDYPKNYDLANLPHENTLHVATQQYSSFFGRRQGVPPLGGHSIHF